MVCELRRPRGSVGMLCCIFVSSVLDRYKLKMNVSSSRCASIPHTYQKVLTHYFFLSNNQKKHI